MRRRESAITHPRHQPPHPAVLIAAILTGIAAISCASIFVRLAEAPPVAIATYRVTLAALVIAPYHAWTSRSQASPWDARLAMVSMISGVFLAFHFIFWISSLSLTSVASSATLVGTAPIFVAVFSFLLWKEKPPGRLKLGVLFTVAGSAFLAGRDYSFSRAALLGDLLAILGAVTASGYLVAGRFARKHLSLSAYTLAAYGSAALTLFAVSFLLGTPLSGFTTETYTLLVLIAVVPQLIGHTAFNWALGFLSPTRVSILILGEPIGATALAYLFLGETLSPSKFLGLAVLASGILLSSQALSQGKEDPACSSAVLEDFSSERNERQRRASR